MPFLSGFELYSRWVPLAYHFSVPALMIFTRVFFKFFNIFKVQSRAVHLFKYVSCIMLI